MRRIVLHPVAEAEADEAYSHYAADDPAVADRFRDHLREGMQRVAQRPETYPRHHGEIRRYLLPKYPYALLYTVEDDEAVLMIAVMHLKRHPDYWKGRKSEGSGR